MKGIIYVFGVRRRIYFKKLITSVIKNDKFGGVSNSLSTDLQRKTLLRSSVVALAMAVVFILQIFSASPGATVNEYPAEDSLWQYPEIEYNRQGIYNGMVIPLDAQLNAKYEFVMSVEKFPVEVLLPNGLFALAGEYDAAVYNEIGVYISGANVVVDREGVIKVFFDAPVHPGENSGHDEDLTSPDETEENHNGNDALPPYLTRSERPGTDVSNNEEDDDGFTEDTYNNTSNDTGDTGTGAGSDSGAGAGSDTGSVIEPGTTPDAGSYGEPDIGGSSDSDSGESAAAHSGSMFDNITSGNYANAYDRGENDELYTIKFEILCYFDLDKLPTMPGDEAWMVEIFNTIYLNGIYTGTYITIEVQPNEINDLLVIDLFNLDSMSDPVYLIEGMRTYNGVINWNDNNSAKRPNSTGFELTLYYQINGMENPEPLTTEVLEGWGMEAEEAAELIASLATPTLVKSGTTGNFWTYTYNGLPAQLNIIEGYTDDEPPEPIISATIPISYSFKMNSEEDIKNNYLIEPTVTPSGYVCTLKEVYSISKVWKDYSNAYGTRVIWEVLSQNLNLSRMVADTIEPLGTLSNIDNITLPNVIVTHSGTENGDT